MLFPSDIEDMKRGVSAMPTPSTGGYHRDGGTGMAAVMGGGPVEAFTPRGGRARVAGAQRLIDGHGDILSDGTGGDPRRFVAPAHGIGAAPVAGTAAVMSDYEARRAEAARFAARGGGGTPFATDVEEKKAEYFGTRGSAPHREGDGDMDAIMGGGYGGGHAIGGGFRSDRRRPSTKADGSTGVAGKVGATATGEAGYFAAGHAHDEVAEAAARNKSRFAGSRPW